MGSAHELHGDISLTVNPEDEVAWHAFPNAHAVLTKLGSSSESGLTQSEAAARLKRDGPNRLTPPEKPGFLRKLWDQLNNVLIWILLAAAVVEGALQVSFV